MRRRNFLKGAGLLLGGSAFLPAYSTNQQISEPPKNDRFDSWSSIREQFLLDPAYTHMAMMLLASHPRMVRDEIEKHRKMFDLNAVEHWENNWKDIEHNICKTAADYMNAEPEEIALTDSTSMSLGLLYTGFKLKEGDVILTSTHDHYATEKSLEYAATKNGATIRKIDLYKDPATVTVEEMLETLTNAIQPATRLIALTWVHSCTGMKLPVKQMSAAIQKINGQRAAADRVYFAIDGVHGFGIENIDIKELGCDFFAAGTHKWLFGPRGTGILWAKKDAWPMVIPIIPSFTGLPYGMWLKVIPEGPNSFTDLCTPGGFHSFEHRWSLGKAFEFHQQIGKAKVEERTHQLNSTLKDGLKHIKHIKLHTPVSPSLSSAINCFDVDGIHPDDVVKKLYGKKIIASSSPYHVSYVRLTPGILNNENEIKTCLSVLENIKSS